MQSIVQNAVIQLTAASVHTANWIIDKCFSGDLIQGRTVLLVVRPETLIA